MMPSCLSILFRALRIEWRETKRTLFPTTPIETGLFLFFFLLYGCIGYRMLFHTELIDVPNGGAGSYLGYDNLFHLHTRGGAFDISHPFFGIFHLLKTLLTILLTTLFKEKTSGIICLTLMNLLITGGLVLIYRYLKQIVRISSRRALLLTGFTGCFFTTVVLSFTTESYPFSFFLLVFSLLMLSREYMLTGYIKGRTILFLSFLCGGITITNAAKPAMALFLNKTPFWHKIRTGVKNHAAICHLRSCHHGLLHPQSETVQPGRPVSYRNDRATRTVFYPRRDIRQTSTGRFLGQYDYKHASHTTVSRERGRIASQRIPAQLEQCRNHVSVVFSRGLGFAQSEKQICTTATYVPEYRFRDPLYHPLRDERGDPVRWALDVCNPDPAGLAIHTIAGPHVPDTGLGYYRILCPDCNDKHDGVYAFLLIRLK